MITVIAHNKREWARLAHDAYAHGRNALGHRFSAAAAVREGARIPGDQYDALTEIYCRWLICGWAGVDRMMDRPEECRHDG